MPFATRGVAPHANLWGIYVCSLFSPTQSPFALQLTYANRNRAPVLKEMGMLLRNVCNVTPGGVVVFFASYAYQVGRCSCCIRESVAAVFPRPD